MARPGSRQASWGWIRCIVWIRQGVEGSLEVELAARHRGLQSSDLGSWTANSPPVARSGLDDAHRWYGVGARESGEGVVAGLLGGGGDSPPTGSGLPRLGWEDLAGECPELAAVVCSDLDVRWCCMGPDLRSPAVLPKVWLAAAGPVVGFTDGWWPTQ
jgi:hypothetical protein